MKSLLIKHDSSVNGNPVKKLKPLWLAKFSRKALVINFDNHTLFGYPIWVPTVFNKPLLSTKFQIKYIIVRM